MWQRIQNLRRTDWYQSGGPWDLLIGLRLYIIVLFIVAPVYHLLIQLKYLSPLYIAILGIAMWLILRFVFLESRTASNQFLKISLILLIPLAIIIFFNFTSGLIFNIIHLNLIGILINAIICGSSILFLAFIILKRPFNNLNSKLTSSKNNWSSRGGHKIIKRNILRISLICWLLISLTLIIIPHPIYIRTHVNLKESDQTKNDNSFGIWTYGAPLDESYENSSYYINNETLEMLGDAGVYFIYGFQHRHIFDEDTDETHDDVPEKLLRCKAYDVEVHISITPRKDEKKKLQFVNLWTFEQLKEDIEEVLDFFESYDLLGDPVTTLVYDMEGLPLAHFPLYGMDSNIINKLPEYYKVQKLFSEFNQHIESDYGLNIKICSDVYQGFDFRDGDDDIMSIFGLLNYKDASRSYMVYRRDNYHQNYILDHCRFLNDGDIIILNSWKFEGYYCWNDIDCAIEDSRLVLSFPGKSLRLEIWALWYFLKSYGIEGLYTLVEALTSDRSEWPIIEVWNVWPNSFYWDFVFYSISLFDLYGPLFRMIYRIF